MSRQESPDEAAWAQTAPRMDARRAREGLERFWQSLSDGLRVEQLWKQFAAEARSGYELYAREVDWDAAEREKGWRRGWVIVRALFWAMLMKLAPARRVLLVIALLLLVIPRIQIEQGGFSIQTNWAPLAAVVLFVLLALELADRVLMKRDLEIAREIQQWLVPASPPALPGVDIAFSARPANTVAGDYYDAFLRPVGTAEEERLLLTVADVAGKSVPAALLMATFQSSLRTLSAVPHSLPDLVTGLNRYACAHSLGGMRFTTAFLAEWEPHSKRLTYINAGHNAPVLRRASGGLERLDVGGIPLGIESTVEYPTGSAGLAPGDVLVIFTDGMVEAFNRQGDEFGESRLLGLIEANQGRSSKEILQNLFASVELFVGQERQNDDMTCLVLKIL